MRLLKFLLYFLALDIGCTIAYCAHNRYDTTPDYDLVEIDITAADKPTSDPQALSDLASIGKTEFRNSCGACHSKNMVDDLNGPALAGVQERWEGREDLLYDWIRNSQAVVASGDEYATKLYRDWNASVMPAFPNLSNRDINALLAYISEASLR